MPNRIIRESLLDSERFANLSSDTLRLLFLEILLTADDYGLLHLSPTWMRRHCPVCQDKSNDKIDEYLSELEGADLVRRYVVNSVYYGYVPRFGNAPRAKKSKFPTPPAEVLEKILLHENNKIAEKLRSTSTASDKHLRANAPETETETETDLLRPDVAGQPEFDAIWSAYPSRLGSNPKQRALKAFTARRKAGISPEEMLEGTRRYAEFCRQTKKQGTEFVMQTATFLGPDCHFREPWRVSTDPQATTIARQGKAAL